MEKYEQRSLSRQKCMDHVFQNKHDTSVLSAGPEVPCGCPCTQPRSAEVRRFQNVLELSVGMAASERLHRISGFPKDLRVPAPNSGVTSGTSETGTATSQLFLLDPPWPIGCQAWALLPRCSATVPARVPPPLPGTDDRSSLTHSFRVFFP